MPARPKRSDEELREASDHLYYEIWMMDTTARLLAMGAFGNGSVKNALLESFTIHARGLLQFFFPEKPRSDDMLAEDFFGSTGSWEAARGEMPQALREVSPRVGKEVAHLTYGRLAVTDDMKPWEFIAVADAIANIAGRFRSKVSDDLLGPRWKAIRSA